MADGIELDLRDISQAVKTITKDLGLDVRDAVNLIGLELWGDVTQISPVDTGRYRAAWNLQENSPDTSVPPPGNGANSVPAPGSPGFAANGLFPVLFLTNALPYAAVLETGTSKKAPDGILSVALAGRNLL
jgi:hypothetical protein